MPVEGWDFPGSMAVPAREGPSWGYSGSSLERMATAHVALDIQTAGGEALGQILTYRRC
jgi:hypothetical protein